MNDPMPTTPLETARFYCDNCSKVSMFIVGRTPRCYWCHSTDGALKPEDTRAYQRGLRIALAVVDEANAICMFCDAKELVQFHPPLCAECRHRASASETLKRLPVLNDPAIGEAMRITEEAFRSPPHEPSARCVDTCNNPLECKEEWDRFHGTE